MKARPRRDLEIVPDGDGYDIRDRYGLRAPVRLDGLAAAVYRALDAGDVAAARRTVARETGVRLDAAELTRFVRELEQAALVEGEAAERDRRQAWARALDGETLVLDLPRSSGQLRLVGQTLLDGAPGGRATIVDGMLSPHGDLATTGDCAAAAYRWLDRDSWPDVFVILGTAHYGTRPALLARDVRTPLGVVTCDRALAAAVADEWRPRLARDLPDFLVEHSWRQDLPLMQLMAERLDRPLRILPILVGDLSFAQAGRLGLLLRRTAFAQLKRVCLVASGDLTHYGAGYGWDPPALKRPRSVAAVGRVIAALETPLLDAIARRDARAFARGVPSTSFCARAQVSALVAFAACDGRLLSRRTVLNWKPAARLPERRFAATDKLFNAASVLFAVEHAHDELRLCPNILLRQDGPTLSLLHRCDVEAMELPADALPLLSELWRGQPSLAALLERTGEDFSPSVVEQFVGELRARHLLHAPDGPASRLARARATIAAARRDVPFYARLGDDEPAHAPFIDAAAVRADWHALFARGALERTRTGGEDGKMVGRWSSGSGGARLASVVEARVRTERRLGERLVRDDLAGRVAHVNRPANLDLDEPPAARPALRQGDYELFIAPGANPTAVSPSAWARTLAAIARFDPDILEGDPSYVGELARRAAAEGLRLPRLRLAALGHCHAFAVQRAAITAAFGVPIAIRYHTSELHEIGLSCDRGALHLIEARTWFEILDGGEPVRPGGAGALVATTLDTRLRPLVRYVLGDVVALDAATCACGRPGRIVRVLGRLGELWAARDGRPLGVAALDAAVGAPAGVRFFRLHPRARRLDVVGDRNLVDVAALGAALAPLVGGVPAVRLVSSLPVPPRAKLTALVSDGADAGARWRRRFLGA